MLTMRDLMSVLHYRIDCLSAPFLRDKHLERLSPLGFEGSGNLQNPRCLGIVNLSQMHSRIICDRNTRRTLHELPVDFLDTILDEPRGKNAQISRPVRTHFYIISTSRWDSAEEIHEHLVLAHQLTVSNHTLAKYS